MPLAGANFYAGQYEFQCLHGMGEPLYQQVVGPAHLNRPCRIYAPVGSHETLLAYLVRRLLENGANTSFVNRIADASSPVEALLEDPADAAGALDPSVRRIRKSPCRATLRRRAGQFGGARSQQRGAIAGSWARRLTCKRGEDRRAGEGRRLAAGRQPGRRRDIVGHVAFAGAPASRRGDRRRRAAHGRLGATDAGRAGGDAWCARRRCSKTARANWRD